MKKVLHFAIKIKETHACIFLKNDVQKDRKGDEIEHIISNITINCWCCPHIETSQLMG